MKRLLVLLGMLSVLYCGGEETQWRRDAFAIWPLKTDFPLQTSVVSWSDWLVFMNAHSREPGVRAIINEMTGSGIRQLW